jgi:1-aminocyclopropane-1-carboxylate deaminase/D-cysteine desulfhydrase-like pyridoxal-dependent ACC family enzyme
LGALGYVAAAQEILVQARTLGFRPAAVVGASASGGTFGGLATGLALANVDTVAHGVDIGTDPEDARQEARRVAVEASILVDIDPNQALGRLRVEGGFGNPGYGVPSDAMIQAVQLLARTEAIFLDPVYTGKAFACLLAMIAEGRSQPSEHLVFLHTGGMPALFCYRSEFVQPMGHGTD